MEQNKIKWLNSWYLNFSPLKEKAPVGCAASTGFFTLMFYITGTIENAWIYTRFMPLLQVVYFLILAILLKKTKRKPMYNWLKIILFTAIFVGFQCVMFGNYMLYARHGTGYAYCVATISVCVVIFKLGSYMFNKFYLKEEYNIKFKPVDMGIITSAAFFGAFSSRTLTMSDASELILILIVIFLLAIMITVCCSSAYVLLSFLKNDPTLEEKCREERESPLKEVPEQTKKDRPKKKATNKKPATETGEENAKKATTKKPIENSE